MPPLLSLSQLQAMRSMYTPGGADRLAGKIPIAGKRTSPTSKLEVLQQSTHALVKKPASTVLTLSAEGCRSLKLLLAEIKAAKKQTNIVTLNLEQVIGRSHHPAFEQMEDMLLFEALEDLLQCDNRAWHRMKFVDNIQVHEFEEWREQKEYMLYHVESIAEEIDMAVRMRLIVQIPCGSKASIVASFLKGLVADISIKTIMISGAVPFKDPADAWKEFEQICRHLDMWNEQKKVEFQIFYDGVDKACASASQAELKPWRSNLRRCINALERGSSKRRERRSGSHQPRSSTKRRRGAARSSSPELEIHPRHMMLPGVPEEPREERRRRTKKKVVTRRRARSSRSSSSSPVPTSRSKSSGRSDQKHHTINCSSEDSSSLSPSSSRKCRRSTRTTKTGEQRHVAKSQDSCPETAERKVTKPEKYSLAATSE